MRKKSGTRGQFMRPRIKRGQFMREHFLVVDFQRLKST